MRCESLHIHANNHSYCIIFIHAAAAPNYMIWAITATVVGPFIIIIIIVFHRCLAAYTLVKQNHKLNKKYTQKDAENAGATSGQAITPV